MKRQILAVGDFFAGVISIADYMQSWESVFAFTDEPWKRTSDAATLLEKLLVCAASQTTTTLQAYRPENHLTITTAQLPQRQRHVDGHDHVGIGGRTGLNPEDTVDRANPIFEAQVEDMCVFISGEPQRQDGKGPRPVWIGQLIERNESTCQGLIRWFKTKTITAPWMTSSWIEDVGWKYGSRQGYNSHFKKTGEWIDLVKIAYWGFHLNQSKSDSGKLRKHDVQVIMFEIERFFQGQQNTTSSRDTTSA